MEPNSVNELGADLMQVGPASVGNLHVESSRYFAGFFTSVAAPAASAQRTVPTTKFAFVAARNARVWNGLARRKNRDTANDT